MNKEYDSSWDLEENGNLPNDEDAFDEIYSKWEVRTWEKWLKDILSFPFTVERKEDEDDAYFSDATETEPFRLGQTMEVVGVEAEDDHYGIIVKVKQGRTEGFVPLCDLEVTSKENTNFWPVREYVIWFANH